MPHRGDDCLLNSTDEDEAALGMHAPDSPIPSPREALRAATGPLHQAVEARFEQLDLAEREDYGAFLLAHAQVIPVLEDALDRAGIEASVPDWARRRRAPSLARDLTELGLTWPRRDAIAVAPGAEALGVAYVLEGSRLGAATLLKTIPDGLPRFFLSHGRDEHLFRSFLPILAAVQDVAAAVAGARRAFGLFLADRAA